MRKKVKRIPKYSNGGTGVVMPEAPINTEKLWSVADNMDKQLNTLNPYLTEMGWADMNAKQKTGSVLGAAGTAINLAANSIGKPVTAAGVANGALQGAAAGAAIGGPWGAAIGAVGGGLLSSIGTGGSVDYNTGEVTMPSGIAGMFGHSKGYLMHKGNMVRNGILSRLQTENLKADYMNQYGGAVKVAEGGIMRRPVDALVSKGELIYDPTTLKLRQVPGSEGRPNKADDVYAKLYEGDVVISNSPTMLMANGKTPAQNLMGMVDKYATGGTVKAREAIIKKVVNWQEANKTKPQEYAKFSEGIKGVNKYGYNKNMSEFAYWDKDKNEYKKEYLDWVNNLTEQDVRDIEAGKYGDMSEYFSKNKGKQLDVATAQKLMTDKKYGNWHKIGQSVVDAKIKASTTKKVEPVSMPRAKIKVNGIDSFWQDEYPDANYHIDYDAELGKLQRIATASAADGSRAARKYLAKQNKSNWLNDIGGLLPVIGGLFDKYDWHKETAQITPPRFVPVNADPRPLLIAADESSSIGNYNLANMGVGTGAYLAHSALLASDRAKRYADAYQWQQETNNKLIAQNAGIYNDWRKQRDAYATQAIADTRANEAAADAQRDTRIKDAMSYYRDWQLTPFLKQYLSSGAYDKSINRLG